MTCRPHCGACCIAPSITRPIPGMPNGKPAGVVCVNLDPSTRRCAIWGSDQYPETCRQFQPAEYVCGESTEEAIRLITQLEEETQ